jgi:hypothetical protein
MLDLPGRDPHGTQGSFKISVPIQRAPASVAGGTRLRARPSGVTESVVLVSLLINGKLVRLCLDITLGSQDSSERKDGDNTWSLCDRTAKVDEVGE